jgi:hypothetical protein
LERIQFRGLKIVGFFVGRTNDVNILGYGKNASKG